jgi:hypothetical protein
MRGWEGGERGVEGRGRAEQRARREGGRRNGESGSRRAGTPVVGGSTAPRGRGMVVRSSTPASGDFALKRLDVDVACVTAQNSAG